MAQIKLTQNKFALVDDEDLPKLKLLSWHAHRDSKTGQFRAQAGIAQNGKVKHIMMHRYILDLEDSNKTYVDHINGNQLDNRKQNLRLATNQENQFNRAPQRNNPHGLKGVSFKKTTGKYRAYLYFNKKQIHIGCYATLEEATLAYNEAAKKHYGKFARLNT